MSIVRWRAPSLNQMERRMQSLFDEPFRLSFITEDMGWSPSVEVTETDDAIEVAAELPGVSRDDVEVELQNNVLTIRGEKKQEKEEQNRDRHIVERYYGSFQRSFALPTPVEEDEVKAEFRNGVLRIHLQKATQARGRKVPINE